MSQVDSTSRFQAKLLCPAKNVGQSSWAFVLLPKNMSNKLPRRGRATVDGTINGQHFQATLDPDGQLSHWLQISQALREAAAADFGDTVTLEIVPIESEPEPDIPSDFQEALSAAPEAFSVWNATTTIARLDWIHWVESAKQAKTRAKRIVAARSMLASGQKRVCCFDSSGFYSKALRAPEARDD